MTAVFVAYQVALVIVLVAVTARRLAEEVRFSRELFDIYRCHDMPPTAPTQVELTAGSDLTDWIEEAR